MASRRGYLTQTELAEYANITISDSDETDDQISQAEELIDAYVGFVDSFLHQSIRKFGVATSGTSTTLVDTSSDSPLLTTDDNFFKGCEIEIIGGTGEGQRRVITSSSKSGDSVTVVSAWTTTPDSTSAYRIYQLGKFPRRKDVFYDSPTETYYKSIPEAIKRATAAQVQYIIEMGADFFAGPQATFSSENLSKYGYTLADGHSGLSRLIAPKAKQLLTRNGLVNNTGMLRSPNPTKL